MNRHSNIFRLLEKCDIRLYRGLIIVVTIMGFRRYKKVRSLVCQNLQGMYNMELYSSYRYTKTIYASLSMRVINPTPIR